MTSETNKAVVRRYLDEVWGRGNFDAIREFLSPAYLRHTSPTAAPLDRDGQIARLYGMRAAFPDLEIEVQRIVAEGDLVAIQGSMRGTHHAEFAGISPTHRAVHVGLADVIRLEGGLFAEHWGGPDMADLARQLRER